MRILYGGFSSALHKLINFGIFTCPLDRYMQLNFYLSCCQITCPEFEHLQHYQIYTYAHNKNTLYHVCSMLIINFGFDYSHENKLDWFRGTGHSIKNNLVHVLYFFTCPLNFGYICLSRLKLNLLWAPRQVIFYPCNCIKSNHFIKHLLKHEFLLT